MHIPDGYVSPSTSLAGYAAVAPLWWLAVKNTRRTLRSALAPRIGLFAAFTFVVMMFNIPLPGGTTGHAVGGALMALALGPWEAVLGISCALALQAWLYGDGGVLALGLNCLNMAVVLPFVAWGTAGLARKAGLGGFWSAFAAGWLGLMAAAAMVALQLGIQPSLFRDADGTPLYNPYALNVALPAILIPHAFVAAPVEALVTALGLQWLRRRGLADEAAPASAGRLRPVWGALLLLVLLSPIGLLAEGSAWGEWSASELAERAGVAPRGVVAAEESGRAVPMPDYVVPGLGERTGYVVAALVGTGLLAGAGWGLTRSRKDGNAPTV
jgi:cobalt/nickel transport system permease protein